jgi:predicted hydrocarbon binding protein
MTKMEKLKEVTELQTIGGLLLDIELRNGMDDLSYMIAEEIPIEMEEGVDEESSEELKELVGDENDDRLISEEVPEESEDEVVDHALIGEKSSSLDEVLLGTPGCEVVEV